MITQVSINHLSIGQVVPTNAASIKIVIITIIVTASVPVHAWQLSNQDLVVMKSGEQRIGEIVFIDHLSCQLKISFSPHQPHAIISIPREHIDFITLAPTPQDASLLIPDSTKLNEHKKRWQDTKAFLEIPKTISGEFGIAYAEALLIDSKGDDAASAFTICKMIEEKSWNDVIKLRAKQTRLRAMIALGDVDDAVVEAEILANTTNNSNILIEAKYILACAAENKLRQLEEEHPRWREDSWVIPERTQLYNEAIDLNLYITLFHGADQRVAARSLWKASQLYAFNKDQPNALASAQDIVSFYPETPYASDAREFLNSTLKHQSTNYDQTVIPLLNH